MGPTNGSQIDSLNVENWHDDVGTLIARAWQQDGRFWFELIGFAVCQFQSDSDEFVVYPTSHQRQTTLRDSFYRVILPFVLHIRGIEALHASAIVANERVFAFCAPSGTGKSTLARTLSRSGFELWADDSLLLDQRGKQPIALAAPFYLRDRKSMPIWTRAHTAPEYDVYGTVEHFDPAAGFHLPLGAIFVLHRCSEPDRSLPRVEQLSSVKAFSSLLSNAYELNALVPTERRRRLIDFYLDLSARIPVFGLYLPNDQRQLGAVVNLVKPLFTFATNPTRL